MFWVIQCEVITINPYSRDFKQACKNYEKRQAELAANKDEQEKLKIEENRIREELEQGERDLTTKGLLYFNKGKRAALLKKAEELNYSNGIIQNLKDISDNKWNQDYIGPDTINDFRTLEQYVNENTPDGEKGILYRLGMFVIGQASEEE